MFYVSSDLPNVSVLISEWAIHPWNGWEIPIGGGADRRGLEPAKVLGPHAGRPGFGMH